MHGSALAHSSAPPRPDSAAARPQAPAPSPAEARISAARLVPGGRPVECKGCGSRAVASRSIPSCPLCGCTRLEDRPDLGRIVAPRSILPFTVDRQAAQRAIQRWARWRWPTVRDPSSAHAPVDAYLPYWMFEAKLRGRYRGLRGERTRSTRPGRRPHLRWRPTAGVVALRFDRLRVSASRSLPESMLQGLAPAPFESHPPSSPPATVASWTERYAVEPREGQRAARARMERALRRAARDDIGGDQPRLHDLHVESAAFDMAHVLLPVWISVIRRRGQLQRVLVDGRTGRVLADPPARRLGAAVLAAVLVVLATLGLAVLSG